MKYVSNKLFSKCEQKSDTSITLFGQKLYSYNKYPLLGHISKLENLAR